MTSPEVIWTALQSCSIGVSGLIENKCIFFIKGAPSMLTLDICQEYAWVRGPAQQPPPPKYTSLIVLIGSHNVPKSELNSDYRSVR